MELGLQSMFTLFDQNVPTIVGAFGVLIIGLIVSLFLASAVTGISKKLGITRLITGAGNGPLDKTTWDRWLSRTFFFILFLLVLVGFFQVLGLTKVSEPLSRFLEQIFTYAPRLIGPAILLVIAWVAATLFRSALVKVITSEKLKSRFAPLFGESEQSNKAMASAVGNAVYLLVFLFFSLAILESLNLSGLLEPIKAMLNTALGFVPNLLAAAAIIFLGSLFAKLLKGVVANLITASGVDTLTEKVHIAPLLGKKKLSDFVSALVYILVMIPVIIAGLNAIELDSITGPSSQMLAQILTAVPSIFAAVLVIVVAYYVGRAVGKLLSNLLQDSGFDRILIHLGFETDAEAAKLKPSSIVEYLVITAIIFFASIEALNLLGFASVGQLFSGFVLFSADVFLGVVIFAFGLFLANLAAKTILSSSVTKAKVLSVVSRIAILIFAGAVSLRQMGIAEEMITITFALLIGAIAIAIGVAFGVGGREVAARLLNSALETFEKRGISTTTGAADKNVDPPLA